MVTVRVLYFEFFSFEQFAETVNNSFICWLDFFLKLFFFNPEGYSALKLLFCLLSSALVSVLYPILFQIFAQNKKAKNPCFGELG